jgi:glycosyltransferase involved in cell wall biosynthesis
VANQDDSGVAPDAAEVGGSVPAAKRILFYYPSNKRTVALETLILDVHRRGVHIEVLTTCEAGAFHAYLAEHGIPVHTHAVPQKISLYYYVRQILHLAKFCRSRGITVVFSNLQHANFIAVFAQFLMPARVITFRHHFKFTLPGDAVALEPNRMEGVFDSAINRLSRRIVVPSSGVYDGMRAVETVDMNKVEVLPYVYDFSRYGQPDPDAVERIRNEYPARLRLLMSSRLIPFKRHNLIFPIVKELVRGGSDLCMLVLDEGPEKATLEAYIEQHRLERHIIMLGFRTDYLNYMAASDILVHPSLTEASSNVVKEMGLLAKTVIVCEGVGDFDEYLTDGRNAFLVPRTTDGSDIAEVIRGLYGDPSRLQGLGQSLRESVLERFGTNPKTVDRYLELA